MLGLWRRQWYPTPVLLPGKSHGRRSLVGCSPWGREELDTTERLHFHFSLSCIGEGNGNPLQCSCLENPMDGCGFSRVAAGFQSYDGDFRLPLVLAPGSLIFHSMRGKAEGCTRVTAGPKRPHLGLCPGLNVPLKGRHHKQQHTRPPCPTPAPGVYSNSCPSSR